MFPARRTASRRLQTLNVNCGCIAASGAPLVRLARECVLRVNRLAVRRTNCAAFVHSPSRPTCFSTISGLYEPADEHCCCFAGAYVFRPKAYGNALRPSENKTASGFYKPSFTIGGGVQGVLGEGVIHPTEPNANGPRRKNADRFGYARNLASRPLTTG